MLQKHSLLKLSQVKKILHDVKPQNFHSINLGSTLKTKEIEKSNRLLIQQNNMNSISRQLGTSKRLLIQISAKRKAYNSTTSDSKLLSKEGLFFSNQVQSLLTRLTGMDYDRIFRVAKLGQHISAPQYQFLTDAELKKAQQKALKTAKKLLQMPPVMDVRETTSNVLDHDSAIEGYDSAKLVFTDITYGVHDRERFIVVREPDGILRHAKGEERDRLNQIYFPHLGRKAYIPAMFKKENLQDILHKDRYLYILDRNCEQFEPDNAEYIATAEAVYEHINLNQGYDILWSSRHFGPMVFYFVWEKKCDDLIAWYLSKRKEHVLPTVVDVIMLYYHIHSQSKFAERSQDVVKNIIEAGDTEWKTSESDQISLIKNFIEYGSEKSMKIHSALNSYLEASDRDTNSNQLFKTN